jgi:hypothetical protein
MNTVITSDQIGGLIRTLLVAVTGWAVGKGYITNDIAATVIGLGVTVGAAVWSFWTNKPTTMIASINAADNGVKVVASTASAPEVTAPLK